MEWVMTLVDGIGLGIGFAIGSWLVGLLRRKP